MRLKLAILSMSLVGAMFSTAGPAQAVPPHCDPAGDLPDLCVVVYNICRSQPKLGPIICSD